MRQADAEIAALRERLAAAEAKLAHFERDDVIEALVESERIGNELVAKLSASAAEATRLREELLNQVSYLGNTGQDADHLWMVKQMRAALSAHRGTQG